jgi:hypothetical protein
MKKLLFITSLTGLLLISSICFAVTWNGYGVHGGSISTSGGQITGIAGDTAGESPEYHWNKSNWSTRTGEKAFYVTSDLNGEKVGKIAGFSWNHVSGYWGNAYFNIMVVDSGGKKAILAPCYNSATSTGWDTTVGSPVKSYAVHEAETGWTGTAATGWYAATWDEVKDLIITDGPFTEFPDTLLGDALAQDDPVYSEANWAAWADSAAGGDLDWEKGGVMITFGQSTGPGSHPDTTIIENVQLSILPVVNIDTDEFFETIQAAIDDIDTVDGHTIEVQTSDFTEPGRIHVTKSVTIQGLGKAATTVYSNLHTSGARHGFPSAAWIYTEPETTVHFADMTLDATGFDTKYGVVFKSGGSVTNVGFNQIKHSTTPYWGIAVQVLDGNVDVSGCTFTEIGRIGVHYRNGVIPGATISGTFDDNVYTGKGDGDWLDYALDISGGTRVNIFNSTISGNIGVASTDGSTSGGILVTTYYPLQQNVPNAVTIEDNELTANTAGVVVGYDENDASVVTINHNNIYGNTDYGVSSTVQPVDATCNWWGAADGPSGEGTGSGDAVTSKVEFTPWLLSAAPGGVCYVFDSCAEGAKNHGQFVSCVAKELKSLVKDGVITDEDKAVFMDWVSTLDIP